MIIISRSDSQANLIILVKGCLKKLKLESPNNPHLDNGAKISVLESSIPIFENTYDKYIFGRMFNESVQIFENSYLGEF